MSIPMSRASSTRSFSSYSSNTTYLPSDPEVAIMYKDKPLPPTPGRPQSFSAPQINAHPASRYSLPAIPSQLKQALDSIPRSEAESGPSLLEMYMSEMFEIGLRNGFPSSTQPDWNKDLPQSRTRSGSGLTMNMDTKKEGCIWAGKSLVGYW